jgi:hypothetical protein
MSGARPPQLQGAMDIVRQLESPELAAQLQGLSGLQAQAQLPSVLQASAPACAGACSGAPGRSAASAPLNQRRAARPQAPEACPAIAAAVCRHLACSNRQAQLAASGALAAFATWRNGAALRALCGAANLQVGARTRSSCCSVGLPAASPFQHQRHQQHTQASAVPPTPPQDMWQLVVEQQKARAREAAEPRPAAAAAPAPAKPAKGSAAKQGGSREAPDAPLDESLQVRALGAGSRCAPCRPQGAPCCTCPARGSGSLAGRLRTGA